MAQFRCAGDIVLDDLQPLPGHMCRIRYSSFSETYSFLQYLSPLTADQPYFFAQILSVTPSGQMTVGIAGPDIDVDAAPGLWINSVGYASDTGKCYTSHLSDANTEGERFKQGDIIGVLVTYFGEYASTVLFLKNGNPVATRFLFEGDHTRYLPTLWLRHGPIDLGVVWPDDIRNLPVIRQDNLQQWIRPRVVLFDKDACCFTYSGQRKEIAIQAPTPLNTELSHFEVVIQELSDAGEGPTIALATCSPLLPTSPHPLLKDIIRFFPDGVNVKVKVGHRLGWGVHFQKSWRSSPTFDPCAPQLVLCYLTVDTKITHLHPALLPPGGFYPTLFLTQKVTKVSVDVETNPKPKGQVSFLDQEFTKLCQQHQALLRPPPFTINIEPSLLRQSGSVEVTSSQSYCRLRLPGSAKGIHLVQLLSPLTEEHNYVCCQIRTLDEDSIMCLGVAGRDFPLNRLPGALRPSVGWHSRTGKIFHNNRCDGNLAGHRYMAGDHIGLEMEAFARDMSVALFSRNGRPVGTSYYTQSERADFLPCLGLCSNGYDLEIHVSWHTMNGGSRVFDVMNVEEWCLPPGAVVDKAHNLVTVRDHDAPTALQAPYSLHKGYNHFEIRLIDDFGDDVPPPAIVLSTATPLDPPPTSHFRLDFLRFWAVNEAAASIRKGDLVGWGLLFVEEGIGRDEEQLVLCYLTVNRKVLLVRVLYQPPGGFYPLVILPQGVNRVQLEFGAAVIEEHAISERDVAFLLKDARTLIAEERKFQAGGGDPHDMPIDPDRLFRPPPQLDRAQVAGSKWLARVKDKGVAQHAKRDKMATLVSQLRTNSKVIGKSLERSRQLNGAVAGVGNSRSCQIL